MEICPHCYTVNRDGSRFCKGCGVALSPVSVGAACPHCGTVLRPGARFCKQCGLPVSAALTTPAANCPNCGHRLRAGALFCPRCGWRLGPRQPPPPRRTAPSGPPCPACGAPTRPGARYCRHCRRPLAAPPPRMPPGRYGTGDLLPLTHLVGRYVILEKIAQGGMGAIYKARDQLEGKVVAVKEMSESAVSRVERERVLESFQREAEILAHLRHPHLVQVSDRFQENGRQYMVMEFVEGKTLKELLEARLDPFPEDQVLIWADQLCDVLSFLHSQDPKIIYRDMKPANVMVVDGTDDIKLIDFGIARFYRPGKRKDTVEMGTDGYAPPEQYGKLQTDERADIYALGAMLHHLLTLRDPVTKPFTFPPVSAVNPKVSRRVSEAIARAVEGARDKRFASIEEMRDALLGAGWVRPPTSATVPPPGKKPAAPATQKPAPPVKRPAPPRVGDVILSPPSLNFGRQPAGRVLEMPLSVVIPAGEQATLHSDAPWLSTIPSRVGDEEEDVKVRVDTRALPLGRAGAGAPQARGWVGLHARLFVPAERTASGRIEVVLERSHKAKSVPVNVTVYPTVQQIRRGQVAALVVIVLEALLALGVLGALVAAAVAMFS